MFHPLSVYVGLRYVRARSHKFFVSFITWASLVGVCVGVAALIVILSVMNGFESELRDRLLSLGAPVRVDRARRAEPTGRSGRTLRGARGGSAVRRASRDVARVCGAAGAGRTDSRRCCRSCCAASSPADAASQRELGAVDHPGTSHRSRRPAPSRVIVGAVIAERLGLARGDSHDVLVPTVSPDGAPGAETAPASRSRACSKWGCRSTTARWCSRTSSDVRALAPRAALSEGLRVRVHDVLAAPRSRRGCAPRCRDASR